MIMNCTNCGNEISQGAQVCQNCGTTLAQSTLPPPPSSGQVATQNIKFDLKRMGKGDMVTGISTAVLIIAMFLPWFHWGVNIPSINGISIPSVSYSSNAFGRGYMYLALIVALALIAYLVTIAIDWNGIKIPLLHWQILGIGAGFDLLLSLLAFLTKPSATSWSFGAYIGLLAAIVAGVGVFLAKNEAVAAS
jgi:hypothetical protein